MKHEINAAIFAGGEGRRMGHQCKALMPLNGQPLIDHVIKRLQPQDFASIAVCANSRREIIEQGYPCIPDPEQPVEGPLAALLAAIQWSNRQNPNALLLTCPCDTPQLPTNLAPALYEVWQHLELDCLVVASHGRIHPTIGLWRPGLTKLILQLLNNTRNPSMKQLLHHCHGRCGAHVASTADFTPKSARTDLRCRSEV